MRSYTQTLLQAFFLMMFMSSFMIWQYCSNQWDYMTYAQQWPAAACIDINKTRKETCIMTPNIKTWTIHGIWPSKTSGSGPFYCNNSSPFVEANIKDLEPLMLDRWPNLIHQESKTSFWKHEWTKHGTCAMSLPALNSEHNYFQKALELNNRYNFSQALSSKNITPSDKVLYKLSDMRAAIKSVVGGKNIVMQCIFSKDGNMQALIQVEMCLNKDFSTRDCPQKVEKSVTPHWDDIPYNPTFEFCEENIGTQYLRFHYTF